METLTATLTAKQKTLLNVLTDNKIISPKLKKTLKFTKTSAVKSYRFLKKHYDNLGTRNTYLVALYQLMKLNDSLTDLSETYRKETITIQHKITDKMSENVNENPNFIPFDKLTEITEDLRYLWMKDPENKINNLTFLIYALFTKAPPLRSEYANMEIVKDVKNGNFNNLVILPNASFFYVNKDKVSASHQPILIKIPQDLADDIDISLKFFPRKYLLQDSHEEKPISTKKLSRLIQSVNEKLTIPMIRSAYISNFYKGNPSEKQKDELALKMRHSKEVAQLAYKKINVN